jgi:hypothetical protein
MEVFDRVLSIRYDGALGVECVIWIWLEILVVRFCRVPCDQVLVEGLPSWKPGNNNGLGCLDATLLSGDNFGVRLAIIWMLVASHRNSIQSILLVLKTVNTTSCPCLKISLGRVYLLDVAEARRLGRHGMGRWFCVTWNLTAKSPKYLNEIWIY